MKTKSHTFGISPHTKGSGGSGVKKGGTGNVIASICPGTS